MNSISISIGRKIFIKTRDLLRGKGRKKLLILVASFSLKLGDEIICKMLFSSVNRLNEEIKRFKMLIVLKLNKTIITSK